MILEQRDKFPRMLTFWFAIHALETVVILISLILSNDEDKITLHTALFLFIVGKIVGLSWFCESTTTLEHYNVIEFTNLMYIIIADYLFRIVWIIVGFLLMFDENTEGLPLIVSTAIITCTTLLNGLLSAKILFRIRPLQGHVLMFEIKNYVIHTRYK